MNTTRQRVIVRTDPSLVGAALGAWLAAQPGFDVVLDPAFVARATEGDVVVVSAPIESEATVFVLAANHVSIFCAGSSESYPYRDLEQIGALIRMPRSSDSQRKGLVRQGGAIDENAC